MIELLNMDCNDMGQTLDELLSDWNDPYGCRDVPDAEDLICMLVIELAGKEEIIKVLQKDVKWYKQNKHRGK